MRMSSTVRCFEDSNDGVAGAGDGLGAVVTGGLGAGAGAEVAAGLGGDTWLTDRILSEAETERSSSWTLFRVAEISSTLAASWLIFSLSALTYAPSQTPK